MNKRNSKHNFLIGCSKTKKLPRFYNIWKSMKQRCLDKKHIAFKRYGGSGITVCKRWIKFENFMEDMLESYSKHVKEFGERQTTIDRINNEGNYELSNCRWATWLEQAHNTKSYIRNTKNRNIINEFAKICKRCPNTIWHRIKNGWSEDEILNNRKDREAIYYDFVNEYKENLSLLKDRYKDIMCYRYGFEDKIIHTLEETGKKFGVSRQRIEQIEKASLEIIAKKLDKPSQM